MISIWTSLVLITTILNSALSGRLRNPERVASREIPLVPQPYDASSRENPQHLLRSTLAKLKNSNFFTGDTAKRCAHCACCHFCAFVDQLIEDESYFFFPMQMMHAEGYLTYEQSMNCYTYCTDSVCNSNHERYDVVGRNPSWTPSVASDNVPTFPPERQLEIEIVTGAVQVESLRRGRQHCYQTLTFRHVTATDNKLCYPAYKPTSDSPSPSRRPPGLNVWTCCRDL